MMDEEGDDFISGNQLGWDMAGQLIRNGWGPSHQVDNGPDTASFPSGIFTAQGQVRRLFSSRKQFPNRNLMDPLLFLDEL